MYPEIQQFILSVRRHNPEARTWRNYACDLKLFANAISETPLSEVTPKHIDQFVEAQRSFKPTTINRRLAAVVSLYRFLDLPCPVRSHRHRVKEPERLARPLSPDELQRFFAVIHDSRDRAMFLLMRFCGLRIAEVAGLKVEDVQLPRLFVHGKGSRERTVYVADEAAQALKTWQSERPSVESEFVFLTYQDKGMSTIAIHKRLMIYRTLSGVSLTAHRLRHSFASMLLSAGVPVTTIQTLMGHRRLETTQGYLLIDDQRVRQDYNTACTQIKDWLAEKGVMSREKKSSHRWMMNPRRNSPVQPFLSM